MDQSARRKFAVSLFARIRLSAVCISIFRYFSVKA